MRILIPFILGILTSHSLDTSLITIPLVSAFSLILAIALFISFKYFRAIKPWANALIIVWIFLLGIVQYKSQSYLSIENHFAHKEDIVGYIGTVNSELEKSKKGFKTNLNILGAIASDCEIQNSKGLLLTYINTKDSLIDLELGDSLIVFSKIFQPSKATNPSSFDYADYLKKKHVFHQTSVKEGNWTVLKTDKQSLLTKIQLLRKRSIAILSKYIEDEDNLAIACAMVLGYREYINDALYKSFSETGAIHVLAVSGLHVGIISMLILFLLKVVPERNHWVRIGKGLITITLIWFFVFLTGAAPAVTRAGCMFTLFIISKSINRSSNIYNIIFFSALLMLMYDPYQLFLLSFQFSFLALLSIVFFFDRVHSLLIFKGQITGYIWSLISVSISAQLLVFPLSIYYFNKFPLYFILSGIVAIPLATIVLSLGFLLIIVELCGFEVINQVVLEPILNGSISLFNFCIHLIHDLPYGVINNIWFSPSIVALLSICVIVFMAFLSSKNTKLLIVSLLLLIAASTNYNINSLQAKRNNDIIIYDSSLGRLLDFHYGDTALTYNPDSILNKSLGYINASFHISKGIKEIKEISTRDSFEITELKEPYLRVMDKVFLIDKTDSKYTMDSLFAVWINKSNYQDLDALIELHPEQVIIDGSVPYYKKESIANMFSEKGLAVHNTSEDGAFILSN